MFNRGKGKKRRGGRTDGCHKKRVVMSVYEATE